MKTVTTTKALFGPFALVQRLGRRDGTPGSEFAKRLPPDLNAPSLRCLSLQALPGLYPI